MSTGPGRVLSVTMIEGEIMAGRPERHLIFGVHIQRRRQLVPEIQALLTEYGCNIRSRIGLHQVDDNSCSHQGLILLEMFGDQNVCDELKQRLSGLSGVEVQTMVFEHTE